MNGGSWTSIPTTNSRTVSLLRPASGFSRGMSQKRYHPLVYLFSATFKDCLVIIRCHGGNMKITAVAIIDLDPKSPGWMKKWEGCSQVHVGG